MIRSLLLATLFLGAATLSPILADCGNCDSAKKAECAKSKVCCKTGEAKGKDCCKEKAADACPMTPEQMAAWAKAATPGPQHAGLAKAVGNYKTASKFWFSADSNPQESAGHSSFKMVLGGRYLQEEFHGSMANMPFEGLGIMGYDNYKRRWTSVWMDTMGTMMMNQTGACSADGQSIHWVGSFTCPVTGKLKRVKSTSHCDGKEGHSFEMWNEGDDGKMFKSLQVIYTRTN